MNSGGNNPGQVFEKAPLQERFEAELQNTSTGTDAYRRLLRDSREPVTIRFFLSCCCGKREAKQSWEKADDVPTKNDIRKLRRACMRLAKEIQVINGDDEDAPNPSEFLLKRPHTDFWLAEAFLLLPRILVEFADTLEPWWDSKVWPRRTRPISKAALQTLFVVYAKEVAGLSTRDVADLLYGAAEALGKAAPRPDTLDAIVRRYNQRASPRSNINAMKATIQRYLEKKKTSGPADWQHTFVGAINLTNELPITDIAPLLHLPRKRSGGSRPRQKSARTN